jgi:pimeloyl-ACP methyl ester carboxylesterase
MRFVDLVLRNLNLLVVVLGATTIITYCVVGVLSIPRMRPIIVPEDDILFNFALSRPPKFEEISLWDRIAQFARWRTLGILVVAGAVVVPIAALAVPNIKRSLVTVALDFPRPVCSKPENRKLLLFIHGWEGDSQSTWMRFPTLACQDSRFADVDVLAVDYPTFISRRNLNLAQLSEWLNAHLDFGETGKYQRVAIVAHSMGGLVSREIVILRSLNESQKAIVVVVEIASPHLGAQPAKVASALGISSPLADEMSRGSSFLTTLQTQWQQIKTRPKTQCYTSPQDEVVSEDSATFQCDGFLSYPQWGHREMVKPESRTDDRYSTPVEFLSPLLSAARPTPSKHTTNPGPTGQVQQEPQYTFHVRASFDLWSPNPGEIPLTERVVLGVKNTAAGATATLNPYVTLILKNAEGTFIRQAQTFFRETELHDSPLPPAEPTLKEGEEASARTANIAMAGSIQFVDRLAIKFRLASGREYTVTIHMQVAPGWDRSKGWGGEADAEPSPPSQ